MTPTPETKAGRITENIMLALRMADVLKDDERGHPDNYNKAYSSVFRVLQLEFNGAK